MKTKTILITLIVMLVITAYVFQSCKKDANNLPPEVPDEDYPIDDSKIFGLEGNLDWGCSDPENDPLTYDLYFGTSSNPELKQAGISDSLYKVGTLIEDTTYYWKIVAKDNKGNVTESPVWDFSTQPNGGYGTMYDERDGQTYITVDIGDQTWMAENLNYDYPSSGCYNYNHNYENGDVYGRLYEWEIALIACPSGWSLPSEDDWTILVDFLSDEYTAAYRMKEAGCAHWDCPNTATNSSGFTGLPGGYGGHGYNYIKFDGLRDLGYWWSSTESSGTNAWRLHMRYDDSGASQYYTLKTYSYSVRCVKD